MHTRIDEAVAKQEQDPGGDGGGAAKKRPRASSDADATAGAKAAAGAVDAELSSSSSAAAAAAAAAGPIDFTLLAPTFVPGLLAEFFRLLDAYAPAAEGADFAARRKARAHLL